jgi:hypothetical protein
LNSSGPLISSSCAAPPPRSPGGFLWPPGTARAGSRREGTPMTHLEMAEALDSMERDVDSWEAGLLDSVLRRLKDGTPLTPGQTTALEEMHAKYFGGDDAALDADDTEEDEDGEPVE